MIAFQIAVVAIELALAGAIAGVLLRALGVLADTRDPARRQRVGNILIAVAVFFFVASGVSKFLRVPLAVTEMTRLGLTGWKYFLVGGMEVLGGVLLLIRPLRSLALLYVTAHMGGAICAHLIASQVFAMLPSTVILSIAWLGMFLRHRQVLWSLREHAAGARIAGTAATLPQPAE